MVTSRWKLVSQGFLAAAICVAPTMLPAQDLAPPQEAPDPAPPAIPLTDLPPGALPNGERSEPRTQAYWIGLSCRPVGEALQAQLNLKAGEGLVVESVMPGLPADQAGLKAHDVLLRAGEASLGSVADLATTVDASQGNQVALAVLRGGKEILVNVNPIVRTEAGGPQPGVGREPWGNLLEFFRQGPGREGASFQMLGPGLVFDNPLPDDLKITIEKKGEGPRKIIVEQGKDKFEVTEDQLGDLTAGVRPYVERLLGRGPVVDEGLPLEEGNVRRRPRIFGPGFPFRFGVPLQPRVENPAPQNLEDEVDNLSRQVEELRRALDAQKEKQTLPAPEGN